MKKRTSELEGIALDWAVAKALGATNLRYDEVACWWFTLNGKDRVLSKGWSTNQNWHPSSNWNQGGSIIEVEKMSVYPMPGEIGDKWRAEIYGKYLKAGPTALIAAMRCYVASKFGDEIEIPNFDKNI